MESEASTTKVEIPLSCARAVWAAMRDDDDLAHDYIAVAIVHALNHLVRDLTSDHYTASQWGRIQEWLHQARAECRVREQEMTERFAGYDDIPF